LKCEWAILATGIFDAATPEVAAARAIYCVDRNVVSNAVYKYVFPIPPGLSMKNAPCLFEKIRLRIISYACFCSLFSLDTKRRSSSDTKIFNSSLNSLEILSLHANRGHYQ